MFWNKCRNNLFEPLQFKFHFIPNSTYGFSSECEKRRDKTLYTKCLSTLIKLWNYYNRQESPPTWPQEAVVCRARRLPCPREGGPLSCPGVPLSWARGTPILSWGGVPLSYLGDQRLGYSPADRQTLVKTLPSLVLRPWAVTSRSVLNITEVWVSFLPNIFKTISRGFGNALKYLYVTWLVSL